MDELTQRLIKANDAYHNGEPIMTDDEFDALVSKWESGTGKRWSEEHGVGASVSSSHPTVKLPMWMGSMDKVKEEKDIASWFKRHNQPETLVVSDKLDGISCLFYWCPKQKTYQVFTRGNGKEGTDITYLTDYIPGLVAIKSLVKEREIHHAKIGWLFKDSLEYFIRGELVISKDSWENERKTTWANYSNPRNTVAGLVGRKLTGKKKKEQDQIEALTRIHFVPFTVDMKHLKKNKWLPLTKPRMFAYLDSLTKCAGSVQTVYHDEVSTVEKESLSDLLLERRQHSPYEIDGIIVWDGVGKHEPNTSGNPDHAFAFKMVMEDQKAETLVEGIEWNVSRQNIWKPVVQFSPVVVGGTRITRATGHNAKWLLDRGIGIGSRITLVRSGDVIPKIHDVLTQVPTTPMPPEGSWEWDRTHTNLVFRSGGSSRSTGGFVKQSHYLVSTLKAKGLSTKNLEKYVERHSDPVGALPYPHLFPLVATKEDWLKVDGVKEKSATTFTEAVRAAWSEATVPTRVVALGVLPRGIGMKQIESLEENSSLSSLLDGTIEASELQYIDGMGPQRIRDILSVRGKVKSVYEWAVANALPPSQSTRSVKQVSRPKKMVDVTKLNLEGKEYVILTGFRNEDLVEQLKEVGIKVSKSLGKKHTSANTFVITKLGTTNTKIQTARDRGMEVVELEN